MSEWDDTTREVVWSVFYSELPKTAADDLTRAMLGVMSKHAVPRAEHERVLAELERLRHAIRTEADRSDCYYHDRLTSIVDGERQ